MITATNFELFILENKKKIFCFYHCLVIWLILIQKVLIMFGLKLCFSCLVLKWNMNFIFINIQCNLLLPAFVIS